MGDPLSPRAAPATGPGPKQRTGESRLWGAVSLRKTHIGVQRGTDSLTIGCGRCPDSLHVFFDAAENDWPAALADVNEFLRDHDHGLPFFGASAPASPPPEPAEERSETPCSRCHVPEKHHPTVPAKWGGLTRICTTYTAPAPALPRPGCPDCSGAEEGPRCGACQEYAARWQPGMPPFRPTTAALPRPEPRRRTFDLAGRLTDEAKAALGVEPAASAPLTRSRTAEILAETTAAVGAMFESGAKAAADDLRAAASAPPPRPEESALREEFLRRLDAFAAAQRGPARMRPALGTRAAVIEVFDRAVAGIADIAERRIAEYSLLVSEAQGRRHEAQVRAVRLESERDALARALSAPPPGAERLREAVVALLAATDGFDWFKAAMTGLAPAVDQCHAINRVRIAARAALREDEKGAKP
jgi:hypothetical protein